VTSDNAIESSGTDESTAYCSTQRTSCRTSTGVLSVSLRVQMFGVRTWPNRLLSIELKPICSSWYATMRSSIGSVHK
jgi:hypothetical protein